LLVLTADDAVARWAGRAIDLGGGNQFVPWVLSLSGVPEISDEAQAKADPELAVLSAVAHGADEDFEKSARIALAAQAALLDLDADRSLMYHDMLLAGLSEAAREVLQAMMPDRYEYQSDFAKRHYAQGQAQGQTQGLVQGRAELVLRQLARRFGELPETLQTSLRHASIEELDRIGERLLTARSLEEALDPR
jgi:flagellar biosynthesis/type III secretory pathway protein FliH